MNQSKQVTGILTNVYEINKVKNHVKRRFHLKTLTKDNMFFTCFDNIEILEPFLLNEQINFHEKITVHYREVTKNGKTDYYANHLEPSLRMPKPKPKELLPESYLFSGVFDPEEYCTLLRSYITKRGGNITTDEIYKLTDAWVCDTKKDVLQFEKNLMDAFRKASEPITYNFLVDYLSLDKYLVKTPK
ncbi:MAG TPA: hypothetical protein VJY62_17380 [Bacteroidia bacterium]|nr:hypothetical protein [Bacteroidia bacterium]